MKKITAKDQAKLNKLCDRGELSNLRMVAGNERKYDKVIDDGELKEWVGFGWITLREAVEEDYEKYPEAGE